MWNFFGENKIFSLFTTQIAIAIFGIMITLPLDAAGAGNILFIPSIIAVMFYLFLLYNPVWQNGAKDKIRIDAGRGGASPFKGLYIGLFANALNIIFALILGICYLLKEYAFFGAIYFVANILLNIGQGMYIGIVLQYFNNQEGLRVVFYMLVPLFSSVCIAVFYMLGRKNILMPRSVGGEKK